MLNAISDTGGGLYAGTPGAGAVSTLEVVSRMTVGSTATGNPIRLTLNGLTEVTANDSALGSTELLAEIYRIGN